MAFIYRRYEKPKRISWEPYAQQYEYGERVSVPWKQLTWREKVRVGLSRTAISSVLAGSVFISLPNGPVDSWGDLPNAANRDDQVDEAYREADRRIVGKSASEIFTMTYLYPEYFTIAGEIDGSGFLGFIGSAGEELNVQAGQPCLEGSGFDITRSEVRGGAVNAPAVLTPVGDTIYVHPAGSDAPPLVFQLDSKGLLVADDATAQTLVANTCDVGFRLYETPYSGSNNYEPLEK